MNSKAATAKSSIELIENGNGHSPMGGNYEDAQAISSALNLSQLVMEFDMDGEIVDANDNLLKALGYDFKEVKGKKFSFFCDPDFAEGETYKSLWKKLKDGGYECGEFKMLGKGGKEVWVGASFNAVVNPDGKSTKIMFFAIDVSESRTELKVRTDIMNLTSIVSEANLKGDIMSINEKFIEVSKYGKEELLGKPHNTTRHPDMPKEVFKEMWATIQRGNIFRGIVKNRAKDGTPYYVDAVIAPIMGENGKPKKYLGVRYDITATETERQNMKAVIRAIDSSFIYAEFDTNGNILSLNKNFQDVMGYHIDDLKGRPHQSFCEPKYAASSEYIQFWQELKAGKSRLGVFKRISRAGKETWLQLFIHQSPTKLDAY